MKKILNFMKQPWFLSLLGFLVLSILIAILAPLIFDESAFLVTTVGILGLAIVWLGIQLLFLLKTRKENDSVLDSLQEMDELDGHQEMVDEELDVLKERLNAALSELKKGKVKEGGSYLYELPWYIIIGPPGSGKTTLLKNSSLKTALSEKFGRDAISGVGGTRHCDWWFTEEAVLLDTAGRYTTQDSHKETDQKAWHGFLELLKKNRTRRPLNGILIAISMDELLTSSSIHQNAKEIRERLQEIYEQFNLKLPVYLAFTKTDLLAGFAEFFDDLDKGGRAQVWGTTFTQNNKPIENPVDSLSKELDLLEDTLKNKVILKLEKEPDLERRKKVYAFPEQFNSIKNSVDQFVKEVFAPSRYQHKILLRGVYFTSAEQTGSPIDKLLNNLSRSFGFEQPPSAISRQRGKSFFIDSLLKKVVFPEAELAGLNPAYENKKRFLQWGGLGAALLVLLIGSGLWITSYSRNSSSINSTETNTEKLQTSVVSTNGQDSISSSLKILDDASNLFSKDDSYLATLGLSQQDTLKHNVDLTYRKALNVKLLPYVLSTLEEGLRDNSGNHVLLLDTLKSYLILNAGHDEPYKENKILLMSLVYEGWQKKYRSELSQDDLVKLRKHLSVLLEKKPSLAEYDMSLNKELVENARKVLAETDISQIIYEQVKSKIGIDSALSDFILIGQKGRVRRADDIFKRRSGELLTDGIQGLFTYKGSLAFRKQSKNLVGTFLADNWVLGDEVNVDVESVREDVIESYLSEYFKVWDAYLSDLELKFPSNDPQEMALFIEVLIQPRSPLLSFIQEVASETYLSKPLTGDGYELNDNTKEKAANEARKALLKETGRVGSVVDNVIGLDALEALSSDQANGEDTVSFEFEELRMLSSDSDPAYDRIIKELDALGEKLASINDSPESLSFEKKRELEKALGSIKGLANKQPKPVGTWLLEMNKSVVAYLQGAGNSNMNELWGSEVYTAYARMIKGKYPVGSSPKRAIPIGDFSEFFAPNGILDSFFNEHIKNSVRKGKKWTSIDKFAPISSKALAEFQRADRIKKALFPSGSQTPTVKFIAKIKTVDPSVERVVLNLGGNDLVYENGSSKSQQMEWPSSNPTISLLIQRVDGTEQNIDAESAWALIEMFKNNGSFRGRGTTYQSTINGVVFSFNTTKSDNIFNILKDLQNFSLPSKLN